jgi:hypothetical protein
MTRRGCLFVAAFAFVLGCGGKLVTERLARSTTGTRQGGDDDSLPDDPPLVAIPSDDDAGPPLDAGCCATIVGWLYDSARACHDPISVVAGCVVRADAAACDPATATPSCVSRSLPDGGSEIFALASTWLPGSLQAAGLVSCGDAGPHETSSVCSP